MSCVCSCLTEKAGSDDNDTEVKLAVSGENVIGLGSMHFEEVVSDVAAHPFHM